MTARRVPALVAILVIAWIAQAGGRGSTVAQPSDPRARLAATVKPVIDAVWAGYDMRAAMGHVEFIGSRWRLPGNPSYNASIDRIRDRLTASGLAPTVEEYPNSGPAWDYTVGTLALVTPGQPDQVVTSREQDHISLCINSFSTAPEGVVARLVDVGPGADADFAGKDVKGAVVLGNAAPGQLWTRAVVNGGALGIVSASPPPKYSNPDAPGAPVTPADQWNIFQWTSVPYNADRHAFAFKASARMATTLRRRLSDAGTAPVSVHVTVASTFSTGPVRTLSIEIPGRTAPAERIVLAAHVQEPGANDNASGVGTLAETVVALANAIKQKKVPQPERTLTFLFLTEISGSRRWLQDHAEAAKQVKYMFSLDMTGEDVKKTGGSFLIERYPDPGAVFDRPWDPHTEWGRGNVRADSLKGDLLNDTHLFVVQQVARKSDWVVHTNPYEGGSDHTEFQRAGIPSVLDWHFTDRYYHSNLDTPDKTSPEEMRNVGVAVASSAWLLASATPAIATDVAGVVAAAGHDRVTVETTEGAKIAATAADAKAAQERETTIVAAWKKWYAEAVRSTSRLVVGTAPASFTADLNRLAATFEGAPAATQGSGSARLVLPTATWLMTTPQAPTSQSNVDYTAIFVCGQDERVATIPLLRTTLVLAGDGRLYAPCPDDTPHDKPLTPLMAHREMRELLLLEAGVRSLDVELRWRAAQAEVRLSHQILSGTAEGPGSDQRVAVGGDGLGGLSRGVGIPAVDKVVGACNAEIQMFDGERWHPGYLFLLLLDESPLIRKEAAYAIGVRLAQPGLELNLVTAATKELQVCIKTTTADLKALQVPGKKSAAWLSGDNDTAALLLEAVGVTRFATESQRNDAELFLIRESESSNLTRRLGAVKGLEALIRQGGSRQPSEPTIARLRGLFGSGGRATEASMFDPEARIRHLALLALQAAHDNDFVTLNRASLDGDWQVRRLVAGSLNLSDKSQAQIAEALANDPAFQVRYDLLSPIARVVARTHDCAPLVARFKDPSPLVAMHAMDLVNAACTDLDATVDQLAAFVDQLIKDPGVDWHLPARALTALARVKPAEAAARLDTAVKHETWQLRAAAATASGLLGDENAAIVLARDAVPNVQTAALVALFRMKSAHVVDEAINGLDSADFQLLKTAAEVMKGLSDDQKEKASTALLSALRRLTDGQKDTSRDPRVAIIERLAEALPPYRNQELLPFAGDYDDAVRQALAKAFQTIVGSAPAGAMKIRRRYPYQPTLAELSDLPAEAVIELESGPVTIKLRSDVAPVTVARFAALAVKGHYNGLTFHRIVPNFVVQGGSPGANEYMGTDRYMRDEVGPQGVHVRGAVGMSTRGGDTGDGQIFIDLVDLPRLDRDYTVFAYVVSGMDLVDGMLEGARIKSIAIRK